MRVEIIEERFFPLGNRSDKRIVTAPSEALALRDKWRKEWLEKHPISRSPSGEVSESPTVSMDPVFKDAICGFSVRKEVFYPTPHKTRS